MAIEVKLNIFEGPLDLLLHLIEKNKVDIYDIPISEITEQYLEYVRAMQEDDLDVMSEFLVMAATLLKIKTKMLLPKHEEEEEEEDPREELVRRLIEYKIYKYASMKLKDRGYEASRVFFKEKHLPEEVLAYKEEVDTSQLVGDLTLLELQKVFQFVMRKRVDKLDPIRSKFGEIKKEEISLEDKIVQVQALIFQKKSLNFRELLEEQDSKEMIVVTFLSILELIKIGKVNVVQEGIGQEIQIQAME